VRALVADRFCARTAAHIPVYNCVGLAESL